MMSLKCASPVEFDKFCIMGKSFQQSRAHITICIFYQLWRKQKSQQNLFMSLKIVKKNIIMKNPVRMLFIHL